MKFAVFTTSTPEYSPPEVVSLLQAQGWDGVEWGVNDFPPSASPSFRAGNRAVWPFARLEEHVAPLMEAMSGRPLEIASIASYVKAHDREGVRRILRFTHDVGARQVRIVAPHVRSSTYRELLDSVRRDYRWVASMASEFGVKALVEMHHRLFPASVSSAMQIVDGLDPDHIGVIHDVGNLIIEGQEDYVWGFEQLGPYLAHVHVKNAVWRSSNELGFGGRTVWQHEWAPLRRGQADIARYFEALRYVGYNGWVTVEDFTTELSTEERLADNLEYLKACKRRAASIPRADLFADSTDVMLSHLRPKEG